jgi:hypothetical protein
MFPFRPWMSICESLYIINFNHNLILESSTAWLYRCVSVLEFFMLIYATTVYHDEEEEDKEENVKIVHVITIVFLLLWISWLLPIYLFLISWVLEWCS